MSSGELVLVGPCGGFVVGLSEAAANQGPSGRAERSRLKPRRYRLKETAPTSQVRRSGSTSNAPQQKPPPSRVSCTTVAALSRGPGRYLSGDGVAAPLAVPHRRQRPMYRSPDTDRLLRLCSRPLQRGGPPYLSLTYRDKIVDGPLHRLADTPLPVGQTSCDNRSADCLDGS